MNLYFDFRLLYVEINEESTLSLLYSDSFSLAIDLSSSNNEIVWMGVVLYYISVNLNKI